MLSSVSVDAVFCRSGHPMVTVDQLLQVVDTVLPPEPVLELPKITGQDLF